MKRILITGAGGFIGGRLVEILKETTNPELNILLRNISKAARISRYSLCYFKGSITNEESLALSMQNCDVVVHCAHDFSNPGNNLFAANLIAKYCLQQRIKKLIYISSFAVHRSNTGGIINEFSALNEEWEYAVNKKAIEDVLVHHYQGSGLPVIILRPTIVYGPFSKSWTVHTVNQMRNGRMVIPFEGENICNAVYIDDVVHAIIKAIEAPLSCLGKAFLVSGPDAISWKEFFNAHLSYAGTNKLVYMTQKESEEWNKNLNPRQLVKTNASFLRDPISFLKKTLVYTLYKQLLKNSLFRKKLLFIKANIPSPLIYPGKDAFETFSCKARADITKLKTELGYQPEISFKEGIKKTLLWVEWANLNSN